MLSRHEDTSDRLRYIFREHHLEARSFMVNFAVGAF